MIVLSFFVLQFLNFSHFVFCSTIRHPVCHYVATLDTKGQLLMRLSFVGFIQSQRKTCLSHRKNAERKIEKIEKDSSFQKPIDVNTYRGK